MNSSNGPRTPCSTLCSELLNNKRLNHESVNGNVLATILNGKVEWMARMKKIHPEETFVESLDRSSRSFYDALEAKGTKFILECKKASPSKGLIRPHFVPEEIASIYDNYAAAISVLADEKFFQGSYDYIERVHQNCHVPVLCKDFIYDPYQILLARKHKASAVLLMLSVLTDEAYQELSELAHSYGMGVLTEASTPFEIERAIKLKARIIGINNRNLRNLTVDLNQVRTLAKSIPSDRTVISESGIYTHDQVLDLKKYVKGFLVGSSLTAEDDIELACRRLILGNNKVCGLTRAEDAVACWRAGACTTGFIFVAQSKRNVTPMQAQEIASFARNNGCHQDFCGVFVNSTCEEIASVVSTVPLDIVQLHGQESIEFIQELRKHLPADCRIWKAIPVKDSFPENEVRSYLETADMVLLDTSTSDAFGGTGKCFDWSLITKDRSHLMVAGGLTPLNVSLARDLSGAVGLDINSGVEDAPGIKNHELVNEAFAQLRDY